MPAGGGALMAGAIVGGAVISGVMGSQAAKKSLAAQKKMIKKAVAEFEKLGVPPDLSAPLILKELDRQGIYSPELEQSLNDSYEESAMAKIKPNEALSKEQMASIQGIKMLSKTGLGAEDRSAYNEIRSRLRQDEQASTASLLNRLQSQGMGGSGAALMASLGNSQQAANLASKEADSLMANASSARRNALTELGRASGDMQQQQFNREAQIATAMDERNRFLQENSIARQQRNVSNLNQAQQANLAEQQRISDYNNQMANSEQLRQRQEQGAFFDRKASLASARASAQLGAASQYAQQANNAAQSWANIGSGISQAGLAYGQYANKNPSTSGVDAAGGTTASSKNYLAGNTGGYENGGIVGDETSGATVGPDNRVAMVRDGEMVLNADQQKGLFDFINRIAKKHPRV